MSLGNLLAGLEDRPPGLFKSFLSNRLNLFPVKIQIFSQWLEKMLPMVAFANKVY
jgi:hypothetical protein